MNTLQPTISIITVVYNGADLLEGTILSVTEQSYLNVEYLIIDGGSNDGTLGIIKKFESQISKWISEPDKGLYDAMNKGMKMATGDFICFMNCGDKLYGKHTLSKAIQNMPAKTDVIYGEVMLVDEQRKHLGTRSELSAHKLPEQLSWKSMKRGMVVCHQAFIPKRSIATPYMAGNISADIDWVINCLKKSKHSYFSGEIIAEYLVGGISKQKHKTSLIDRYSILKKHFGFLPNLYNHFVIIVRAIFLKIIRIGKFNY